MTRELVNGYLQQLSAAVGAAPGSLGTDGEALIQCSFAGAELQVRLMLNEAAGVLALGACVASCAAEPTDLALALLAANLLGAATQGLTFSYSPKDRGIYLGYSVLLPLPPYAFFEEAFTRLVAAGAQWSRELNKNATLIKGGV